MLRAIFVGIAHLFQFCDAGRILVSFSVVGAGVDVEVQAVQSVLADERPSTLKIRLHMPTLEVPPDKHGRAYAVHVSKFSAILGVVQSTHRRTIVIIRCHVQPFTGHRVHYHLSAFTSQKPSAQ